MRGMNTFRDIIAAWPDRQSLADDLGVTLASVHKWAQRNSIPAEYDKALVGRAGERGLSLGFADLAEIRASALEEGAA